MKPNSQNTRGKRRVVAAILSLQVCLASALLSAPAAPAAQNQKQGMAPLPLVLPGPTQQGTPPDLPSGPNIEPPPDSAKPKKRTPFLAPAGVSNLALGKQVSTSAEKVYNGALPQIT